MDTRVALEKLLNVLVKDEYPKVTDIKVSLDNTQVHYDNEYSYYSIAVGMMYNDLQSDENSMDILIYIRKVAKYVMGEYDKIVNLYFFDPNS